MTGALCLDQRAPLFLMKKLAQVTFAFWVMKICATTLGETLGDFLSKDDGLKLGYGLASAILISFFLVTLVVQLVMKQFHPAVFWTVILSTSTAGTTISDYMDRTLELGYATGSLILLGGLALVFIIWKLTGDSFRVAEIKSFRTELLYWIAILFSNTLGTALGDYLADDSGLGFMGGAALIGGIILLLGILYLTTKISRVLLFWLAFILTRPFGANLGDVLSRDHDEGGLGFGTLGSSAVLLGVLVAFIIGTMLRGKREATAAAA